MSLFLLTNVLLTVRTLQSVENYSARGGKVVWLGVWLTRCSVRTTLHLCGQNSDRTKNELNELWRCIICQTHTVPHKAERGGATLTDSRVLAVCVFDHFLSASSLLLSLVASCDFTKLRTLSLCKASRACNAFIVKAIRGFLSEECGPIESLCLCLYVCLSPLIVSSCTAEFQPLSLASIAAPLPRAPGLSLRLWLKGAFLL